MNGCIRASPRRRVWSANRGVVYEPGATYNRAIGRRGSSFPAGLPKAYADLPRTDTFA